MFDCLFVEKVKYYGVDAEEGEHNNSDEQRLEGKAEEIEKDETGSKNRSKRAATTEEQKDDSADSTRKVRKVKYSKGKGKPEKSESDKLLEKYFAGMHDYYNDFLLACALFNGSRFVIPITIIAFLSVFLLQ